MMKQATKKRLILLCSILLIVVLLFVGIKYGWRLFGYRFCEDPDTVVLYGYFQDDGVKLQFVSNDSFAIWEMEGYKYHIEGNTMYIGVKVLPVIARGYGDFTIKTDQKIEKVILVGKGKERVVNME